MENIIKRAENLGKRKMLSEVINDMITNSNIDFTDKYMKQYEELEKEYELLENKELVEKSINRR